MKINKFFAPGEIAQYANRYLILSKEHKIITPIVSKCGSSTISNLVLNREGYPQDTTQYHRMLTRGWVELQRFTIKDSIANYDSYKRVAIIRDPLNRIESSYTTLGNGQSSEEYLEDVIFALQSYPVHRINRHIASQFVAYDKDKIDLFVPLMLLDKYLNTIDIGVPDKVNCSKEHIKFNSPTLNSLLQEDYMIYNEILNSNKCFK